MPPGFSLFSPIKILKISDYQYLLVNRMGSLGRAGGGGGGGGELVK